MKQSKFTISNRREKILNHMRENGSAKVEELSELCRVSPLTIRRDLDSLVQINAVRRNFGGAQLLNTVDKPATFEEKKTVHHSEKIKIAQAASRYISDGCTVFMNSGTTVLQVISALTEKNVTIITNNALAYEYAQKTGGDIICTGGVYSDSTKAYVGDFAVNILSKVYADVCVLGVNGINAVSGVTTSVLQETNISDKMVERCTGKVIVVADGSKIGRTFSFVSVKLSHIDLLITDSSADSLEIEKLRSTGLKIIILD
ncbi:MAG: DeoR/GlpR family DNA-binding transcription regulator [Christensenella sp.]